MELVVHNYGNGLARYLSRGFSFSCDGRALHSRGLSDCHELHDAMAETFRRAFEERAHQRYDGAAPYERLLHTIARDVVLDRLKSARYRKTVLVGEQKSLPRRLRVTCRVQHANDRAM